MPVYQELNKQKITKDKRSWYYRCYYTDIYGNRKQKISKLFLTRKLAQEAERDFLNKISCKSDLNENIAFIDVYNEWLEFRKKQLKTQSLYSLKKRSKLHIVKFLENYKLHAIKLDTINKWFNELEKNKISTEYKNKIINEFKCFLKYARDNYNFDNKIIAKIQPYKIEKPIKNLKDSEINFWTYDEFQQFISVVDDEFYYTIFNFLYFTGLRYGEMCALNWNDFNKQNKTIEITKTLTDKVDDRKYIITSPKTQNSIRIVDLDDNLYQLLLKHKNKEKQLYNFNENMFIFGNIRYLPATTFRRKLNYYIKLANVKKITIHGFRHSHISLLIHLGCDSREVALRVGDTVQMIEKTYIHLFPRKKKETVIKLNLLKK